MTKGLTLVSESKDVAWALIRAAITIGRYFMLKNIVSVNGGQFKKLGEVNHWHAYLWKKI